MIRTAIVDDVPQIVEMARRFRASSSYQSSFDDNPEQLEAFVGGLVLGAASVIFVLAEPERLVGMIGLVLYPHLFDGEPTVAEVAWWVEPEARGNGSGVVLLRAAEAWAQQKGARRILMIAPEPRVGQFYEREGYSFVEMTYQKAVAVA